MRWERVHNLSLLSGFSLSSRVRRLKKNDASVMKLVYMGDSKSPAARRAGSSPAAGTTFYSPDQIGWGFFMPKI